MAGPTLSFQVWGHGIQTGPDGLPVRCEIKILKFHLLASWLLLRRLFSGEVEHDVRLGNAANQSKCTEIINHRQSFSADLEKLFQSSAHALNRRDPRKIFVHEFC